MYMMKRVYILFIICFVFGAAVNAQTLYIDVVKGNDGASGGQTDPVASLEKAVLLAKNFKANEPVTFKIAPGLYTLTHQLEIGSAKAPEDTGRYTFEALVMPDDSGWNPYMMPVIQSVSANNTHQHFNHCAGLEIKRSNVRITGLKFVGNANPATAYYYPIERDSAILENLEVSQCYFIGERNSSPVQGAMYVQGAGIHVDHCIFYGCKNALLVFDSIKGLVVTNSIIYGAYEAAVWHGDRGKIFQDVPFRFENNIVYGCNYFWLEIKPANLGLYTFRNSLISGNEHILAGQDNNGNLIPFTGKETYRADGVRTSGVVLLSDVKTDGLPKDYLNLLPASAGYDLHAGIFK
jgi:hypothetical protein